jgi:hypothetical protein
MSDPFATDTSGREIVNLSSLESNLRQDQTAGSGAGVVTATIARDGNAPVSAPVNAGGTTEEEQAALEFGAAQKFLEDYDDWGANDALPFSVQRAFRIKFMVLLQLQLFSTLAIAAGLTYYDPLKGDLWASLWFVWFFMVVISWTYLMKFADKYPYNYVLLVIFTICLGWFFGKNAYDPCWLL